MSAMNQSSMEAISSANYLNTFLACLDHMPDELQKLVTQLQELEMQTNEILTKVQTYNILINSQAHIPDDMACLEKRSTIKELSITLVRMKEVGDMKLSVITKIIEEIEEQSKRLEVDLENLDPGSVKDLKEMEALDASQRASSHPLLLASVAEVLPSTSGITGDASNTPTTSAKSLSNDDSTELSALGKRTWRRRTCAVQPPQAILAAVSSAPVLEEKKSKDDKTKKKKLKRDKTDKKDTPPVNKVPVDPSEPKYCHCNQISFGEMIGCDNSDCVEEWFHFSCVNLINKPKGKWYCPKCRGDRSNMRKEKTT